MHTHDIKLPPHDATANLDGMKPVRLYSEAKVRAAIEAERKRRGEPVAFSYDLATTRSGDGEYTHWSPRLSYSMPNVPDGSIRNLQWLYAAPVAKESLTAAEPVKVLSDEEVLKIAIDSGLASRDSTGDVVCAWREDADISEYLVENARALLARYANQENANDQ